MRWPMAQLNDVAQVNPRRDRRLRSLNDNLEVTFVPMSAVDARTGTIAAAKVRALGDVRKGFTSFVEGDVIFAKITPCMQNGKSAIARGLVNGIGFGSTEFHVLRPSRRVVPEWIWYFVRQRSFRERARKHFRGSAGQQRVPATFVEQCEIPLPSIDEQRGLVSLIGEVFTRLDEIQKLRLKAVWEASAIFSSLLADRFRNLIGKSRVATINDVARETRYGTSRRCSTDTSGTPVLRIPNISGGAVNSDDMRFCDDLTAAELSKLLLRKGDLLIVRSNGSRDLVGRCAVFDGQDRMYAYASYVIRIRLDFNKVLPQFLAFFLESGVGRNAIAERRRTSAGQYNINSKNLRTIPFPCPPLDIQRYLVEEMVHKRRAVGKILDEFSEVAKQWGALRQSVLRKAFVGEY